MERSTAARRARKVQAVLKILPDLLEKIAGGTPTYAAAQELGTSGKAVWGVAGFSEEISAQLQEAETKGRKADAPHGTRTGYGQCGWCWECREFQRAYRDPRQRKGS